MDSRSIGGRIATIGVAALTQAAVFVAWRANLESWWIGVVLEIVAGVVIGLLDRQDIDVGIGLLLGGTTAGSAIASGKLSAGFVETVSVAFLFFAPGYLIGSGVRRRSPSARRQAALGLLMLVGEVALALYLAANPISVGY